MSVTITCPACEAEIRPPGGRKEGVTQCPWCGASLAQKPGPKAPEPAVPAPPPLPEPPPAEPPVKPSAPTPPKAARPTPPPVHKEPREPRDAPASGNSDAVIAAVILLVSTGIAAAAFFAARFLASRFG